MQTKKYGNIKSVSLKIAGIKTIFKDHLYSVQYDGCSESEFTRLFNLWKNPENVDLFIDTYKDLMISPFWVAQGISASYARRLITQEAVATESHFLDLYLNTINGDVPDFNQEFVFLDKQVFEFRLRSKHKMYGTHGKDCPSFLRIYAIKVENNCFLITGGAIKLTHRMDEAEYLQEEVRKLNTVHDWLEQEYILDVEDLNNYESYE